MNFDAINLFLDSFITYNKTINNLNKSLGKRKIRKCNMPSEITENIVRLVYNKLYKEKLNWNIKGGDLCLNNLKIEVKGFTSTGPTSFGPTEKWDIIYFVNAIDYKNKNFIIYECKLSNNSEKFKNINLSKTERFEDSCKKGKRPRICFNNLYSQLQDNIKIIFDGNLMDLYNNEESSDDNSIII